MLASGLALNGVLGDVVFLAITIAFFGVAWLLIRACERIAGDDGISAGRIGSGTSASGTSEVSDGTDAPRIDRRGETESALVGGRA